MISGTEIPYRNFNLAYLICLPKTDDGVLDPSATRPLSIVDSINRILASVFRVTLERVASDRITSCQRGFIKGRNILQNIVDIDFAAQKVSIKRKSGAILLLDFRSAFPSLDQNFMWEALETFGIPGPFIEALKLFYRDNHHILRHGDCEVQSITVHSGVRQECPLCPKFFLLSAQIFCFGSWRPL